MYSERRSILGVLNTIYSGCGIIDSGMQKTLNNAFMAAKKSFLREITLYRTPQCKGGSLALAV